MIEKNFILSQQLGDVMLRKYLLPILAILGAIYGLVIVNWSQKSVPTPPILFPPATSPYPHAIAAAGIIEASSQNISIGTPFNEIITKIHVIEGDFAKAGDILFELDVRSLQAQAASGEASIRLAEIDLENKKKQFSFYERLNDTKAVSEQEFQTTRYAYLEAEENLKVAQAMLKEVETNIERSIIRAPVDGKILQVNIHVGEIAPVIPFISPQSTWLTAANGTLILMGAVDPLEVRIDIDEDDAWRFSPGANATAFVRGNRNIKFPLKYFRVEPYIIPKRSFTGLTSERVDTRVLQTLYLFDKADLPVYTGQILDIYIEALPIEEAMIKYKENSNSESGHKQ